MLVWLWVFEGLGAEESIFDTGVTECCCVELAPTPTTAGGSGNTKFLKTDNATTCPTLWHTECVSADYLSCLCLCLCCSSKDTAVFTWLLLQNISPKHSNEFKPFNNYCKCALISYCSCTNCEILIGNKGAFGYLISAHLHIHLYMGGNTPGECGEQHQLQPCESSCQASCTCAG